MLAKSQAVTTYSAYEHEKSFFTPEYGYAANTSAQALLLKSGEATLLKFPNAHRLSPGISLDLEQQIFTVLRAGDYSLRYSLNLTSPCVLARLCIELLLNGVLLEAGSFSESSAQPHIHLNTELIQRFKAGDRVSLQITVEVDHNCSAFRLKFLDNKPAPEATLSLLPPSCGQGAALTLIQLR